MLLYYINKRYLTTKRLVAPDTGLNRTASIESEIETTKKRNYGILLAVPSFLDMLETSFKNITLTLISASVTQMLRSSVVIFTALLALIFLNKRLYLHHWTSMAVMILGIFLVGLQSMKADDNTNIWGIIILLVG